MKEIFHSVRSQLASIGGARAWWRIVFVLVVLSAIPELNAQVKFQTNLTHSRLGRLAKAKDAKTKLKRYKKMYNQDSIKAAREEQRHLRDSLGTKGYKVRRDSLENVRKFGVSRNTYLSRGQQLKIKKPTAPGFERPSHPLDSLKGKIPDDSLRVLKRQYAKDQADIHPDSVGFQTMARYGMYGAMMDTYASRRGVPGDSASMANQLAMEDRVKAYLPEELQSDQEFGSFQSSFGSGDPNNPTKTMPENLPPEQMQAATAAMSVLKKGYISVPNSNDMSTAKKRNSLEGAPLKQRIFIGGNVALASIQPAILDIDLQVGYKFTRDFVLGVGFIVREQFDKQPSTLVGDAYGHSVFANYDLPLGIFAYAEAQRMKTQSLFQENGPMEAPWEQAYMVGIGKEIPLNRVINLTAMVLYDLNHKHNDLHPRPIVVRFGYRMSELAFRKK